MIKEVTKFDTAEQFEEYTKRLVTFNVWYKEITKAFEGVVKEINSKLIREPDFSAWPMVIYNIDFFPAYDAFMQQWPVRGFSLYTADFVRWAVIESPRDEMTTWRTYRDLMMYLNPLTEKKLQG